MSQSGKCNGGFAWPNGARIAVEVV